MVSHAPTRKGSTKSSTEARECVKTACGAKSSDRRPRGKKGRDEERDDEKKLYNRRTCFDCRIKHLLPAIDSHRGPRHIYIYAYCTRQLVGRLQSKPRQDHTREVVLRHPLRGGRRKFEFKCGVEPTMETESRGWRRRDMSSIKHYTVVCI